MGDDAFVLLPGERLDLLNSEGLRVIQPEKGYCFSMDAVLLSHFARVKKHEHVIDLGTGSGVIPLLLHAREKTLLIDALELDEEAAERAARSVRGNGLEGAIRVLPGDLRDPPGSLPRAAYHLVLCNPPYGRREQPAPARVLPTTEAGCTFRDIVRAAGSLLRFSGRLSCCWPAQRLQDALDALSQNRFAVKRLRPVYTRPGKNAYLCLIEAVLGGRPGLTMEPALNVLTADGAETEEIRRIYGETGQ